MNMNKNTFGELKQDSSPNFKATLWCLCWTNQEAHDNASLDIPHP